MSEQKHYVGNGWRFDFQTGGYVINLSLKMDELINLPKDDYGCIRLSLCERKEKDPKSKSTHYVIEDQRPQKSGGDKPKPKPAQNNMPEPDPDDPGF